jgi:signal transduction histidine kinase
MGDRTPTEQIALAGPGLLRRIAADGRCDFCGESWLRLTGQSAADALGDGWTSALHEEDRARALQTIREHARAAQPFEHWYRLRRADGRMLHIFERGEPHEGALLLCGMESRERYVDLVAHELRTPLQAMSNFLVAAGGSDPALVGRLSAQVERLSRVVESLAQASGRPPSPSASARFDLVELAREVVGQFSLARADRRITLHERSAELPVSGDRDRLSRALFDLLDNAIKFSPGRDEVLVEAWREGDRAIVRVSDRGIGVPAAEIARLGQRWFRGSNADARRYPGLGLGLAMASETAQLHGGRLLFDSEAGKGTRATIELPVSE